MRCTTATERRTVDERAQTGTVAAEYKKCRDDGVLPPLSLPDAISSAS